MIKNFVEGEKSMKKKLLSSLLSLVLCFTLVVGSTYALFTSESKVNIAVSAGTVNVVASVKGVELYSMGVKQEEKFENGGTATVDGGNLALSGVTAGDKAIVTIAMENKSDVTINYHIETEIAGPLETMLVVNKVELDENGADKYVDLEEKTSWAELTAGQAIDDLRVSIELPVENSAANGVEDVTNITIKVIAQQGNAPTVSVWDGVTRDTSWYTGEETEYEIDSAAALAGLADLVDAGAINFDASTYDVEGELEQLPGTNDGLVFKLTTDVDLRAYDENGERISFDPIGYGYDVVFEGTFDGEGHTISNLYQNGWALGLSYGTQGGGLFASVKNATIKNVNIEDANVVMECVDMGILVGYSYGNCTYENITISGSKIANYQRYTGGLVGEVNGTQTFKNITIEDTTVGSLWGDFDASVGGIVGGKYGEANLTFEDCYVDCVLDVHNDVISSYQWYAYRRAGMLIGNSEETTTENGRTSATASYLTCKEVTVVYGDWANYTYCEFTTQVPTANGTNPNSWPYVRVQAGLNNGAYSNPRYGNPTADANGNKVVDDNHVHNDGEDHNILLAFDQLFGGGQGVYGTATHEGVRIFDGAIERK